MKGADFGEHLLALGFFAYFFSFSKTKKMRNMSKS
jgi:hypothetical protein